MTNQSAQIDFRILSAVSAFASTEATRYYLAGVSIEIEPRATIYVATDGSRLMAYRDELPAGAPDNDLIGQWIIPTTACKATKFKNSFTLGRIVKQDGGFTLQYGDSGAFFKPVDGTFPAWRQIYPRGEASGQPGHFDWTQVATFSKFAKALDLPRPEIMHDGTFNPARISFNDDRIAAVIMPWRASGRDIVPSWIDAKPSYDFTQAAE